MIESAPALSRLAISAVGYFENGQHTVALDEFKKVVQIDPGFGDAYNLGGMIYMALNDVQVADAHFQRALSLNPRDANALHNIGWLQCEQRRWPLRQRSRSNVLAVPGYPGRARTLMTQGICEARAGDRSFGRSHSDAPTSWMRRTPSQAITFRSFICAEMTPSAVLHSALEQQRAGQCRIALARHQSGAAR